MSESPPPLSDRDRQRARKRGLDDEAYARLRAEAKAPYRGLRIVVYAVCGASGLIGALVFLLDLLAGRASADTLPNFALQLGVIALMIFLFRWENRPRRSP
jgi:hypothetical protein